MTIYGDIALLQSLLPEPQKKKGQKKKEDKNV